MRHTGRPRGLPNGRAVVGAFLVTASIIGVFATYRGAHGGPSHTAVVASRTIATGTTLTAADVTLVAVDLPADVHDRAFERVDQLVGRLTVAPMLKGELVQEGSVADRANADGHVHVSFPIERARALDGTLVAGERVEVLATYSGADAARTLVVARRAEVVRVSSTHGSLSSSSDLVVVLAVPTIEETLAVTHASQAGKLTLVRSTGADIASSSAAYQTPTGRG